jgi:hypothetical protein
MAHPRYLKKSDLDKLLELQAKAIAERMDEIYRFFELPTPKNGLYICKKNYSWVIDDSTHERIPRFKKGMPYKIKATERYEAFGQKFRLYRICSHKGIVLKSSENKEFIHNHFSFFC